MAFNALHNACRTGNAAAARECVARGRLAGCASERSATHACARSALAAGADLDTPLNAHGLTCLMLASQHGHAGAPPGAQSRPGPAHGVRAAVVGLLCDAGADVQRAERENGFTALLLCVSARGAWRRRASEGRRDERGGGGGGMKEEEGRRDEGLKEEVGALTRERSAAAGGHAACVARLLASGADAERTAHTSGFSALMLAAQAAHAGAVRALLRGGASANQRKADTGGTALLVAAMHGSAACVQALLDADLGRVRCRLPSRFLSLRASFRAFGCFLSSSLFHLLALVLSFFFSLSL